MLIKFVAENLVEIWNYFHKTEKRSGTFCELLDCCCGTFNCQHSI